MKSSYLVRIKIEGLADRWVAKEISDMLLTTRHEEARQFRTFQNAADAAGKWQRLLTGITNLDFNVIEEESW